MCLASRFLIRNLTRLLHSSERGILAVGLIAIGADRTLAVNFKSKYGPLAGMSLLRTSNMSGIINRAEASLTHLPAKRRQITVDLEALQAG